MITLVYTTTVFCHLKLLFTGEKLSKKELQNSNIIKKLKEKNKQNDQLLMAQRSDFASLWLPQLLKW